MRTQYLILFSILSLFLALFFYQQVQESKKTTSSLDFKQGMSSATTSGRGLKAIVVGSTGLVGKNVVRVLSQQNPQEYAKIVAISRRKDNPFNYETSVPIEHITLDSLDNLDQISDVFNGVE